MNHKKNSHYIETDHRIQEALLQLVSEDKTPTVAEICRRTSINRTTFYLHYADIVELMQKIQSTIFSSFIQKCEYYKEDVTLMSFISYQLYAEQVKENKAFYKHYFKMNTSFPLKDGYENLWDNILIPHYHSINIYDEEVMRLRFVCFQAGFTITTRSWVEQDCNLTCEQLASILKECITL